MGEALLVRRGGGGVKVTVDGEKISKDLNFTSFVGSVKMKNLSLNLDDSYPSGVAMSDGIHLIYYGTHLLINGNNYTELLNCPVKPRYGTATTKLNDALYYTYAGDNYTIYKFSDGTWTLLDTPPCFLCAFDKNYVYGSDGSALYRYDGNAFTQIKTGLDYGSNLTLCDDGTFYYQSDGDNNTWLMKMNLKDLVEKSVLSLRTSNTDFHFTAVGNDLYRYGNSKLVNNVFVSTEYISISDTSAKKNTCIIVQDGEMHGFKNSYEHWILNAKLYKEV